MTSFWNAPQKKNNSKKNNNLGYTSFKKESIKSKKLSKYGDADLDGSPNVWDCDPRKVSKDAYSRSYLQRQIAIRQSGGTGDRPAGGFMAGGSSSGSSGGGGGGSSSSQSAAASAAAAAAAAAEAAEKTRLQAEIVKRQTGASYTSTYVAPPKTSAQILLTQMKAAQKQTAVQAGFEQQRIAAEKSYQAAQKSAAIQRAQAQAELQKRLNPPLTAKQKALIRSTGFLALAQSAAAQRRAKNERFKTLKQREFEKKYPGYYYNESYF